MTKEMLNTQNPDSQKNYIVQLLEELTIDYQKTKQERKEIVTSLMFEDEEFTLLEEIELLTVDIRGYASQIKELNNIDNPRDAVIRLQNIRIFDIPTITRFYLRTDNKYEKTKAYLRMLDYLRLLLLEYLNLYLIAQSASV
ncbi:MAG: hypothetical protein HC787_09650 [Nostocaceae cyanobacterium CSU_2_110]|nr:hypothetical protein [Richelia sp. SL_2_1]NJS17010.1 hypothetical protein [Nostocaceae cyanobacterium CSU_2_110]